MRTIAVVNQKGGVGKTTVTINLAAALAERGQRVCLVDLDPQGDAGEGLGVSPVEGDSLARHLLDEPAGDAAGLAVRRADQLDVIPAADDMFFVEARLVGLRGREQRLRRFLEAFADRYDIVLLDCPPSLGQITDNALIAADAGVLIVMQPEDTSLRALDLLLDQMESIHQGLQVQVPVVGLVANFVDDTTVAKNTMAAVERLPLPLLGKIRKRTKLKEAWGSGKTILELEPNGDTATAYRDLAAAVEKELSA